MWISPCSFNVTADLSRAVRHSVRFKRSVVLQSWGGGLAPTVRTSSYICDNTSGTQILASSKDLQLALWLTEAGMKLHGFPGLRDGLRLTRELMVRYWNDGLFPPMEDGPEDRAGPFEWLNNKLVDSVVKIPITAREDGHEDLSLLDLQDARHTGSEEGCKDSDGEIDSAKRKAYDAAIATGHVSLEAFERAVAASKRAGCEAVYENVQAAWDEFKALERVIDEKFGDLAPNMSDLRTALSEIRQEVTDILAKKRAAEPDNLSAISGTQRQTSEVNAPSIPVTFRIPLSLGEVPAQTAGASGTWQEAEVLIKSGQVDKGLAEMVRLAACETSGRSRFLRKLLLAEACFSSKRERLARSILEELAEHIDKLQLESWESSELIASVWTKLHKLYQQGTDSGDRERAAKLYERLCRLDPWQALGCSEE